jgi:hypothetical protein
MGVSKFVLGGAYMVKIGSYNFFLTGFLGTPSHTLSPSLALCTYDPSIPVVALLPMVTSCLVATSLKFFLGSIFELFCSILFAFDHKQHSLFT